MAHPYQLGNTEILRKPTGITIIAQLLPNVKALTTQPKRVVYPVASFALLRGPVFASAYAKATADRPVALPSIARRATEGELLTQGQSFAPLAPDSTPCDDL